MDVVLRHEEFDENEQQRIVERDRLGRVMREYFPRIHPLERYSETKFQARYRLTRNMAAALADVFGRSEFATSGRQWGGGLTHRDRVSGILTIYISLVQFRA